MVLLNPPVSFKPKLLSYGRVGVRVISISRWSGDRVWSQHLARLLHGDGVGEHPGIHHHAAPRELCTLAQTKTGCGYLTMACNCIF